MNLKSIFLPWLVIRELERSLEFEYEATVHWMQEHAKLRSQLSKFDHDGDGRVGGSRKAQK